MDKLSEAICFATNAFGGLTRKCGNHPAILHSLEAAVIADSVTDEREAVIAAVLHDTVEDAGVALTEIEELFGKRVAALVAGDTENKREELSPADTWKIRKQESIDLLSHTTDIGVKVIFLSDKLSNIRSLYRSKLVLGDKLWDNFNQKNPKEHEWYYRSILGLISEFSDTVAYKELSALIDKTFSEE